MIILYMYSIYMHITHNPQKELALKTQLLLLLLLLIRNPAL